MDFELCSLRLKKNHKIIDVTLHAKNKHNTKKIPYYEIKWTTQKLFFHLFHLTVNLTPKQTMTFCHKYVAVFRLRLCTVSEYACLHVDLRQPTNMHTGKTKETTLLLDTLPLFTNAKQSVKFIISNIFLSKLHI